jgi:hypothetical protein
VAEPQRAPEGSVQLIRSPALPRRWFGGLRRRRNAWSVDGGSGLAERATVVRNGGALPLSVLADHRGVRFVWKRQPPISRPGEGY